MTAIGGVDGELRRQGLVWGLLGVLLAGYGVFLLARFAPAIVMPDDNGYFAQASLLVRTGASWFVPESDAQYIGMHWLLTPEGKYVSRYPAGLSAVIAGLYSVLGWQAGVLANPLLAVGALVGVFFLARLLMPGVFAVGTAAVLALNPTFNAHALAGDAHIAVTCALVWGCYFLVRWSQSPGFGLAVAAGLLLGAIPVIRYPDGIMAAGFAALIGLTLVRTGGAMRGWVSVGAMAAAAVVPMVPQLVRNQLVLGAFWRTGYSLSNEQTGFGWSYFASNWQLYVRTINSDGIGLFFGLGLAGMAAMVVSKPMRGVGIMMLGCCTSMLLLYMAYYWAGMGGNGAGIMRFLLPTFALYAVAGMYAVARACEAAAQGEGVPLRFSVPVVAGLLGVVGLWGVPEMLTSSARTRVQRENLARVTRTMESAVPAGSVVLAEPGLLQHLDYVREWKLADPSIYRGGPMVRGLGRNPDEPSPMQAAKSVVLREKYPGTMEERRGKFVRDVEQWAGGSGIFVVGSETEIRSLGALGAAGTLREVARVPIDAVPTEAMRRGGMGGMGPGGGPGGGGGVRPDRAPGIPDPFAGGPPEGPGGAGGIGQRRPGGGGGGGGIMSMGTFGGAREVVIAEWVPGGR